MSNKETLEQEMLQIIENLYINWKCGTLDVYMGKPGREKKIIDILSASFRAERAERMYNEIELFTEELKDKIDSFEYSVNQNSYISDYIKEWVEQFKKK
jgi:hypothetical protein